jgi:SAM-dependent methyltransferase
MQRIADPAAYEDWYHTPRGQWIGEREGSLLRNLLRPEAGDSLLDVGCGTGYFTRHFARLGLSVTGIDPDPAALRFAHSQGGGIRYLQGSALELPFPDQTFDCTLAVTSLCFIDDPLPALREMWRVTRHALVLGLLNRYSLLHREKHGHGGYAGARWDTARVVVRKWLPVLVPMPEEITVRSAIFLPRGNRLARWSEQWLPAVLPWGGFLAIGVRRYLGSG